MFNTNDLLTPGDYLQGIKELIRSGETANLDHWGDGKFILGDENGNWHFEGFVNLFQALHEAMRAVDPSIPPGLPAHVLDPEVIAKAFHIPLEKLNVASHAEPAIDCTATKNAMGLPKEVSTAEAGRILGISKDTVLKLKAAGLLKYRNTAPPDSFRPVFAFSLQSVLELRTKYEQDIPMPRRPKESPRRRVKGERKYEHLRLTPD